VHAQPIGRQVGQSVIERLNVERRLVPELVQTGVAELDMPAHRQVRTIDLEHEPAWTIAAYSSRIASAMAAR
jgi:hypothetical protein